MVNEGTAYLDFTVGNSDSGQNFNENMVIVETLEMCFVERIDREMGNFVDKVRDRIQKSNRDYCPSQKRIWKEQHTTCVKFKGWDSKQVSCQGRWVVGPRYTFWLTTTNSSQLGDLNIDLDFKMMMNCFCQQSTLLITIEVQWWQPRFVQKRLQISQENRTRIETMSWSSQIIHIWY